MDAWGAAQLLPELSNFYCHPGKAGGSPLVTSGCSEDAFRESGSADLFYCFAIN